MIQKVALLSLLIVNLLFVFTLGSDGNGLQPAPALAQTDNFTPLQQVVQVSTGGIHTCALTTTGAVKCWGANTDNSATAVVVPGLPGTVTAIAAGGRHACTLTTAGAVLCWGANTLGQLGDGTTVGKPTPVAVQGLDQGVTALVAGSAHTCAVLISGSVKCWGFNEDGQLGDGTSINKNVPTAVTGLNSAVIAIAAGVSHTCALTVDGVKCWGYQEAGLGDGITADKRTPVAVSGLESGVVALAAGGRTYLRLNDFACRQVLGQQPLWRPG